MKKGVTLTELMIVVAVMAVLMVVMAPYFYTMRITSTLSDRRSEVLQNARVGLSKMVRDLRQARRIISVTAAADTNGRIVFINKAGSQVEFKKYNDGTNDMLGYVSGGQTYPLAGPITSLTFDAKKIDASTSTTIPALIKSVNIALVVADAEGQIAAQTFSATIDFRKNFIGALYYACYSNNRVRLNGSGTLNGDVQANNQVTQPGSITVNGTVTDSDDGINVPMPTVGYSNYTVGYDNYQSYEDIADHVYNSNFTFTTAGSPYSGIYYIGNNKSASFQPNVILNGTVVAERNITIDGNNVTINSSGTYPAAIAGNRFDDNNNNFTSNGTIYCANGNINIYGRSVAITPSTGSSLALVAANNITADNRYFTANGSLIALNNVTLSGRNATVTASNNYPAIVCGGRFLSDNQDCTITGVVFAVGNVFFDARNATLNGAAISGDVLRFSSSGVNVTYDSNVLYNPPPFFFEP